MQGERFSATDMPTAIDGVEIAVFEGEAVLFHEATSMLHRLGAIAGGVWLCCDGDTDVAAMIEELARTFDLDAADMAGVVHQTLERFADEGLLVGHDAPVRTTSMPETTVAEDGTEILTRPSVPCGTPVDPSVRAGLVTLRIGDRLVGLRADTDDTLRRLRILLAAWIDDRQPDVPWAFDVRLSDRGTDDAHRRGVRPIPQLRAGQLLMARSRCADDVLRALTHVLGGVLASQDTTRTWSGLRVFACEDRAVLVDAQPPALAADSALARAGIDELPSWFVAVDDAGVHVPPPLDELDWPALGLDAPPATWRSAELVGLVAFDRHLDRENHDNDHPTAVEIGVAFSRFAARQASTAWFSTVERLTRAGRVTMTSDRATARRRIIDLLTR